jgi:stearoyl-CoA desaturase (Delta-9 desaturase)
VRHSTRHVHVDFLHRSISPVNVTKTVGILTLGESFHNYHHVFPWDYKISEMSFSWFNPSIALLDFFASIGWAYDLKTASDEMIQQRTLRTGDGSHKFADKQSNVPRAVVDNKIADHTFENSIWGWDDKAMTDEDKKLVTILNPMKSR